METNQKHEQSVYQKQILFKEHAKNTMICSVENEDDFADLEELRESKTKVKQLRLEEILGKQWFFW